jgi:hypothetical protein
MLDDFGYPYDFGTPKSPFKNCDDSQLSNQVGGFKPHSLGHLLQVPLILAVMESFKGFKQNYMSI